MFHIQIYSGLIVGHAICCSTCAAIQFKIVLNTSEVDKMLQVQSIKWRSKPCSAIIQKCYHTEQQFIAGNRYSQSRSMLCCHLFLLKKLLDYSLRKTGLCINPPFFMFQTSVWEPPTQIQINQSDTLVVVNKKILNFLYV